VAEFREKRFDIQLMRGVAVLGVVIFHALGDVLPKGFLGVDVFFVISGFLITGMILRQLGEQRFGFLAFYARRARRLLPASLSTLAVTTLLAAIILVPGDYGSYAKQLIGALTFSANFAIAQQTGYFDAAAQAKPLMHIWSLSLEEQFYFLAPLLLWLTPLRARPWLLMAATAASLILCFWGGSMTFLPERFRILSITLAYFMLPSRAWELLIGGLAAWVMLKRPDLRVPGWAKHAALGVILLSFLFGVSPKQPGPDALIASLMTAVVLMGRDGWLHHNIITRAIARIGDWSYSVYLVHWPLISFAFIVYLGDPPVLLLIALGLLAVVLGWAQYRFVELLFLDKERMPLPTLWIILAGGTGVLMAAGMLLWKADVQDPNTQPLLGLAANCNQTAAIWQDRPECRNGTNPTVFLWGDSHAEHLVPGLVAALGTAYPMEQATQHGCAPTLGLSEDSASPELAKLCRRFNEMVAERLSTMPSIRYVIVSAAFESILFSDTTGAVPKTSAEAKAGLVATIDAIQKAGKVPILIASSPRADFDVGACTARTLAQRWVLGRTSCDFERSKMGIVDAADRELAALGQQRHVIVLRPVPLLCGTQLCASTHGGSALYRDTAHFTLTGSMRIVDQLGVRRVLDTLAAEGVNSRTLKTGSPRPYIKILSCFLSNDASVDVTSCSASRSR
jgi:peptidoglycan/LPS O-acetylase OafA/YrhL